MLPGCCLSDNTVCYFSSLIWEVFFPWAPVVELDTTYNKFGTGLFGHFTCLTTPLSVLDWPELFTPISVSFPPMHLLTNNFEALAPVHVPYVEQRLVSKTELFKIGLNPTRI